jgi:hypothetical protein
MNQAVVVADTRSCLVGIGCTEINQLPDSKASFFVVIIRKYT